MAMYVNQTHCGEHFKIYTNVKSLCCTPETNIILYVNYASKKKVCAKENIDQVEEFKIKSIETESRLVVARGWGMGIGSDC